MTNHLTDEQRERIARAMGWYRECDGLEIWWVHDEKPVSEHRDYIPRYDEPGPLHEEMRKKYCVHGKWIGTGYRAYTTLPNSPIDLFRKHDDKVIAECLAVLAYLDSEESKND